LTEFEFQRYMPRRKLTHFLNQFDLIQVVSGSPVIANVAKDVDVPVCLFAATMINLERGSMLRRSKWLKKIYGCLMLPIVSKLEKQALKHVDHIFAETIYTKQALEPFFSEEKFTIDSVGIDIQRFKPNQQRSDDYILCTGRLSDPRKNVAMLFAAYALVRRQMVNAPRLVLAGISGPSDFDWEFARELGILDHVKFHLEVPKAELVDLYQNAAVYVLSSDEEGLGIVLLEAMACATPVISTRCGGPDSVVSNDVGFLTPVGDSQVMADRILWMLRNPEQRRLMGQAGRQMVESRFSNEVVGKKYLDVYDRLLGVDAH
jgi:glycosyltransferase involved in cell wall biosynthesis